MKHLKHYVLRAWIALLSCGCLSSCYDIHLEMRNGDLYFTDDKASKEQNLFICPLEPISIHCSILGGLELTEDKKEIQGVFVDYQIRVKRSNGHEDILQEGQTRTNVVKDWTIFSLPAGTMRLSLWIKESDTWEEKDYVELPIREQILPLTITLRPDEYSPSGTQLLGWQGTFTEAPEAQHGRSPQAVIDRIIIGGGHPFIQLDALDIELNNSLVGIRKTDGSFDPSGNTHRPYPNGTWRVKPSNTPPYVARTWSDYDWKNAGLLTLTVYYRCTP